MLHGETHVGNHSPLIGAFLYLKFVYNAFHGVIFSTRQTRMVGVIPKWL
ncbi:hypothetical protein PMW_49 [Pseudomonas phage phiPMW]|uniref:Uncharacterized protein n=1 Tax=Pseudomonas phage phiPMW TaxID=1815582 RepID=A0A1S5R188_9CAUD|nr:hypothetical protein FDG97_gp049 [Pseudomonas phage phiPMW]ANA49174.1 hypothetical protein PMW_49 [Pseudomonas phage phiPMW]